MAAVTVLVWRIDTTYDTPDVSNWNTNLGPVNITAGNHLHVIVDDVTFAMTCDYRSSSTPGGGSYLGTLTEGPNLFFGYNGAATLLTAAPYWQTCDGTVLRRVGTSSNFPYGTLSYNPGALECAVAPTCDLEISSYTTTDATGPATADGSLTVVASSSNGTIKYAINDPTFDYTTEGQTSPTFTGLLPNTYIVYAKDAIGCTDQITIEVAVTIVYGVKYRLEFTDTYHESQLAHRIDILERAYSGAVTEMCAGGDPGHVRYSGDANDPLKSIIPSQFLLQVQKRSAGEYADLFTDDDRKFKVIHYTDSDKTFPSPSVYWTGYIVPEFYSEPYIFEPFDLDVTVTDQLGEMKNLDFVDMDDNLVKGDQKAIKLIAEVLKKTDLNLNIRCAINMFSVEMTDNTSVSTNDPLDQAYVDSRLFLTSKDVPLKCDYVLQSILEPFGARIFQSMGYWWLCRISDVVGSFDFREFDVDGDYSSNASLNPVQNLDFPSTVNRAIWEDKTQLLSHLRNYGYFSITHNAGKDSNLIDEGRFEVEDVIELGSGNKVFKNWNVFQAQTGATYGFEYVRNGDSNGAFFLDLENANYAQADNKLYSVEIPISNTTGLKKIQFQYFIEPRYAGLPYIRLGWSVRVTNGTSTTWMKSDFPPDYSRANNTEEIINEIYVTSFNTWNTFELTSAQLGESPPATLQITFYMHNHYGRDFDDITDLKTFSISGLDDPLREGRKVMVGEDSKMYVYTSVASLDAESLPDIVRPNDYASDFLWTLDKIVNLPPNNGLVKKFLIDNVKLSYFYQGVISGVTSFIDPPETVVYEEEVSTFVKSNLNRKVVLGDMPRFNDEFEDNERLIYRGYFRLSDGSPTTFWKRDGVLEEKRLLQISLEDLRDQFSVPKRKLSGAFRSDILWNFINSIEENFEGSRYQFLTMDFDLKKAQYTVDIAAVGTSSDGEPPLSPGAFESDAFSTGFLIGT